MPRPSETPQNPLSPRARPGQTPFVECDCPECNSACRNPGALLPEDLQPIAEYLGSTPLQLVGTRLEKDIGSDVLRPSVKQGWCIFYDRRKHCCRIHAVKPFECRQYYHRDTWLLVSARLTFIQTAWLASRDSEDDRHALP